MSSADESDPFMDSNPIMKRLKASLSDSKTVVLTGVSLATGDIAGALSRLIEGPDDFKARFDRMHATVKEVHERLGAIGAKIEGQEDWWRFTASASEKLSTATNEDARQRFRDLLFNAAAIPDGDPLWEEARWCLDMLKKLRPAALAILSLIHRTEAKRRGLVFNLRNETEGEAAWVERDEEGRILRAFTTPSNSMDSAQFRLTQASLEPIRDFKYKHINIREALSVLEAEGLIFAMNYHVQTPDGNYGVNRYSIADPGGRTLIDWTLADS